VKRPPSIREPLDLRKGIAWFKGQCFIDGVNAKQIGASLRKSSGKAVSSNGLVPNVSPLPDQS